MKKLIVFLLILAIIASLSVAGLLVKAFLNTYKEDSVSVQSVETTNKIQEETVKEETITETKEEETTAVKEETKEEIKYEERKEATADTVFKMLDFDRRYILKIGMEDDWLCSIFDLAYARAILERSFSIDPYDYYDGNGAGWKEADYEDIALDSALPVVLQRAYDRISVGQPVLFFVDGKYGYTIGETPGYRSSEDHYVLLIGYRKDADYEDLRPSDFYAVDPSGGYCCGVDTYKPWIVLSDEAPALTSGEYALYAPIANEHIDLCLAYPDTCNWNAGLHEAISPLYAKED